MVEFSRVLNEVEKRFEEAEPPSYIFTARLAVAPPFEHPRSIDQAIAGYQSVRSEPASLPQDDLTFDSFCVELQKARGSAKKLGALRRDLAWRLHPDRARLSSEVSLAQVNAAIDDALARCISAAE